MSKLNKEQLDSLSPEDFAIPETRDIPLLDVKSVELAWNLLARAKGTTPSQRAEGRKRIIERAKTLGIDTSDWEAKGVSAASMFASISAMSLNIPTDPHPNKVPFSGILTRIGEPSDAAPEGSDGRRVMLTTEAATRALDSLLGMAVDFQTDFAGHDPKAKIGLITEATIEANAIRIGGYLYAADFPEIVKEIKANKDKLGFSFEARNLWSNDPKGDPIPIIDCVFTGAAILFKDKAAYHSTSISASKAAEQLIVKDFTMNDEVKGQFDALAASIKQVAEMVQAQSASLKEQGDKLAKLEADKVEAANQLAKIEPHAKRLEDAADKMENDGIGGEPRRGHVAVLRHMAGDLRAAAAQGKMPHVYDAFYASNSEVRATAEKDATVAVEAARKDADAKLAEVKAAAEKVAKESADKVAALETQVKDLKAAAEKTTVANGPERKTLSPGQNALLAKAGVQLPTDGSKLDLGQIDQLFAKAGIPSDKRIELKTGLARIGALA